MDFSKGNRRLKIIMISALLASSVFSPAVLSQTQSRNEKDVALEEIVVTARRREENLQQTPISITALSATDLERRQITTLDQITEAAPNIVFEGAAALSGSPSGASVYIRGIGQSDFTLTTEPGVGVYVDGVYFSQSFSNLLSLIEIERVEILRGPQGTLFGRNTIGGAVSVITRKPEKDFYGRASLTTGRYDRIDGLLSMNVPLSDTFYVNFAATTTNRDGFVRRVNLGGATGDDDSIVGRIAARWLVNDRWEVNIAADYARDRENPAPGVLLNTRAEELFPGINPLTGMLDLLPPVMIFVHNTFVGPQLAPQLGPEAFFDDNQVPDELVSAATFEVPSNVESRGIYGSIKGSFSNLTFRSITSYRNLKSLTGLDFDNTPLVIGQVANLFDVDQFSQEIQFFGTAFDAKLDWILGLYHFTEDGIDLNRVEFSLIHFLSGSQVDNRSSAVFGQFTYDITRRLSITLGGRYTDERKRTIVPDTCFDIPLGPVQLMDGSIITCTQLHSVIDPKFAPLLTPFPFVPLQSGDAFIPRGTFDKDISEFTLHVGMAYEWSEGLMTYATYTEGFKSGGFVQRINAPQPPLPDPTMPPPMPPPMLPPFLPLPFAFQEPPSFDPEFAKVFEIGFKSSTAANRFRLNGALFYTDYQNLQITVSEGLAPITKNAAEASIKGFELEATAVLAAGWLLSGGIGYLDAKYDNISAFAIEQPEISLDSKFVNTPKWQLNASVSYEHDLGNAGQWESRFDWSFRSTTQNDARNTPEFAQDGFHLLNLSSRYTAPNGKWSLIFFVRNLTDKRYLVSGFDDPDDFGAVRGIFGRPREWSAKLQASF